MNRLCWLAVVAIVVAALRGGARACEPIPDHAHTIDTSMQATDRTPPTLPVIPAPTFHYGEDVSDACTADCVGPTYVAIPAVATDDMTESFKIGYRFSLASGTLPPGLALPSTARDPLGDIVRVHFPDTTSSMDFTLQVVAIDLAGNESTPQTVHVEHHADSGCSIAGGRVSRSGGGWIVFAALIVTGYRRRRRPETC